MSDLQVFIIAIAAIVVFGVAAQVGETRAKAMEACYKAAQVNTNIKCDVSQ